MHSVLEAFILRVLKTQDGNGLVWVILKKDHLVLTKTFMHGKEVCYASPTQPYVCKARQSTTCVMPAFCKHKGNLYNFTVEQGSWSCPSHCFIVFEIQFCKTKVSAHCFITWPNAA